MAFNPFEEDGEILLEYQPSLCISKMFPQYVFHSFWKKGLVLYAPLALRQGDLRLSWDEVRICWHISQYKSSEQSLKEIILAWMGCFVKDTELCTSYTRVFVFLTQPENDKLIRDFFNCGQQKPRSIWDVGLT